MAHQPALPFCICLLNARTKQKPFASQIQHWLHSLCFVYNTWLSMIISNVFSSIFFFLKRKFCWNIFLHLPPFLSLCLHFQRGELEKLSKSNAAIFTSCTSNVKSSQTRSAHYLLLSNFTMWMVVNGANSGWVREVVSFCVSLANDNYLLSFLGNLILLTTQDVANLWYTSVCVWVCELCRAAMNTPMYGVYSVRSSTWIEWKINTRIIFYSLFVTVFVSNVLFDEFSSRIWRENFMFNGFLAHLSSHGIANTRAVTGTERRMSWSKLSLQRIYFDHGHRFS